MNWILSNKLNIITITMNTKDDITYQNSEDLERTVYSSKSNGQDISVIEKGFLRSLYFGKRALQSTVDLRNNFV